MAVPRPFSLLLELTHTCPLSCPYCSNPMDLIPQENQLSGAEWSRVIEEAADMGVVQVHFSGGEPLDCPDLEQLVGVARARGMYTNLITSGIGLHPQRAQALYDAGLDSVQLSIQAADRALSDRIAGRKSFDEKHRVAELIKEVGFPLSLNVVLHSLNIDQLEDIIDMCAEMGAQRLELANTQYYGWAAHNRLALMPSREQVARAEKIFDVAVQKHQGTMEIIWVIPDYYAEYPKPCMGGWGQMGLTVAPDGVVLPCPTARMIDTLQFDTVKEHSLEWIWTESASFNAYRGFDWMPEPCQSCDRRFEDMGGCRCQAFLLTGDAGATDPVCSLSPDHHLIKDILAEADAVEEAGTPLTYRRFRRSG